MKRLAKSKIDLLLDSSVVLAYLHKSDSAHLRSHTVLEAAKERGDNVWVHHLVFVECIRRLRELSHCSLKEAIDKLESFLNKFAVVWRGGPALNWKSSLDRYKKYSTKTSLLSLTYVDFMLATEIKELPNIYPNKSFYLLTGDKKMFRASRNLTSDIVFCINDKDSFNKLEKLLIPRPST